jgi:DivIVA domain-containing protein
METNTTPPSFTVSLRGYDREEVDEYLDSLADALGRVEQAEESTRRLQAHVGRLNARIKELEERIRSDTPRSGAALGERIGQLLSEAEQAAADTVVAAKDEAAQIIAAADARTAEAEELMRSVTARAEGEARRIETAARSEASEIVAEADSRAAARTRQIEQWAEQVISHTRAEEARMIVERQKAEDAARAQLHALADQRAAATRTLTELRDALTRAVTLTHSADEPARDRDQPLVVSPAAEPAAIPAPPAVTGVTGPTGSTGSPGSADERNPAGEPASDLRFGPAPDHPHASSNGTTEHRDDHLG